MALFQQQQPQTGPSLQYYTLGQHKSVLLVGLGNVGREYVDTRHNAGFICLDAFVQNHEEMTEWTEKKNLKCFVSKGVIGGALVVAVKPTTLMNNSGTGTAAASHFYKISPENILAIHDELDIPFGQIRMRTGGGSAGHNGIKSLTAILGENYSRIRIGIGPKSPPEIDSADFVLQRFNSDEAKQLPLLAREVNVILTEYIFSGKLPNETRSFLL